MELGVRVVDDHQRHQQGRGRLCGDSAHRLDLVLEARDNLGFGGEMRVHELERDDLTGLPVARLPNGAHGAVAKPFKEREAVRHCG